MSLLTIIQTACGELGLTQPSTVIGNTDPQATQLLALANREGKEFAALGAQWGGWPELRKEYTFSLVPAQTVYALPSDIQMFISATQWDRNFRWQMFGPLSPQEWQTIVSGISPVGPRLMFRVMANQMNIRPAPGSTQTDTIAYEYISNCWCMPTATTVPTQTAWTVDSDLYAFPEDTAVLGLKWRYLAAKGLNYSEERAAYDAAVERQTARSGGNRSLPLNASSGGGVRLLGWQNIPDTGFGT